jgi:hypothetical protein
VSPSPSSSFCREITPVLTRSCDGLKMPFGARVGRAVSTSSANRRVQPYRRALLWLRLVVMTPGPGGTEVLFVVLSRSLKVGTEPLSNDLLAVLWTLFFSWTELR